MRVYKQGKLCSFADVEDTLGPLPSAGYPYDLLRVATAAAPPFGGQVPRSGQFSLSERQSEFEN